MSARASRPRCATFRRTTGTSGCGWAWRSRRAWARTDSSCGTAGAERASATARPMHAASGDRSAPRAASRSGHSSSRPSGTVTSRFVRRGPCRRRHPRHPPVPLPTRGEGGCIPPINTATVQHFPATPPGRSCRNRSCVRSTLPRSAIAVAQRCGFRTSTGRATRLPCASGCAWKDRTTAIGASSGARATGLSSTGCGGSGRRTTSCW